MKKKQIMLKWAKSGNKAARHAARIRMARQWFAAYKGTGKHIVRAYREKFKVDVMTALNDLGEIGALTPDELAAKKRAEGSRIEQKWREREDRKQQELYDRFPDSNDQFFYIAGYTSGGAPYGVTWEEMGLQPYQDPDDIDWDELEEDEDDMWTLRDELNISGKNAIALDIFGEAPHEIGGTKFGGAPDVPSDFVWPVFETAAFDDDEVKPRPLAFLAQFNCAKLARRDRDKQLPRTGLLSFFYELGSQRWGYDPQDRGCARVFWFPDVEGLSPAPFPDTLEDDCRLPETGISMRREKSYPDYEDLCLILQSRGAKCDPAYDDHEMARAELGVETEVGNRSQLLGWPDTIQGNMTIECELVSRGYYLGGDRDPPPQEARQEAERTSVEDWQLLLQLDTVEQDGFELMFGDCGRIYFYIRKEDLKARQFDNIWLVLQCY